MQGIASRGVEPAQRETYSNGVRKATYRDPDGNEIGRRLSGRLAQPTSRTLKKCWA